MVKHANGWLSSDQYELHWHSYVMQRSLVGPGGCILWTGWTNRKGYAASSFHSRNIMVHRKIFELANKVTLGRFQFVCHSCDVPNCINIDHLWLGTPKENIVDCIEKKRQHYQNITHCPRGHEYTTENIQWTHNGKKRQCRRCNLIRGRLIMGWPEDLACSLPPKNTGGRLHKKFVASV